MILVFTALANFVTFIICARVWADDDSNLGRIVFWFSVVMAIASAVLFIIRLMELP